MTSSIKVNGFTEPLAFAWQIFKNIAQPPNDRASIMSPRAVVMAIDS